MLVGVNTVKSETKKSTVHATVRAKVRAVITVSLGRLKALASFTIACIHKYSPKNGSKTALFDRCCQWAGVNTVAEY